MAIIEPKPILEIPSHHGLPEFSPDSDLTLEDAIKADFGEEGLARFKEFEIYISAPVYQNFKLGFDIRGDLEESISSPKVIGKVYTISMGKVSGVDVRKGAPSQLDRQSDGISCLSYMLDLNPAKEDKRYLKLLFQYK